MDEAAWLEMVPRIEALITHRLIAFYDALVERGQIPRSYPPEGVRVESPPGDLGLSPSLDPASE